MKKCCCNKSSVIKEERCKVVGWANINSNGSIQASCGDISSNRISTGRYQLTPPVGAETALVHNLEPYSTRDDIQAYKEDFLATSVYTVNQDNGQTAGTPVNSAFNVVWYGRELCVVDII